MKKRILSILLTAALACTVLAGCKKNVGTPEDNAVVETEEGAEEEEERRLFYVAMTRAKDVLKITYVKIKNGKDAKPSRFVDELFEGV